MAIFETKKGKLSKLQENALKIILEGLETHEDGVNFFSYEIY